MTTNKNIQRVIADIAKLVVKINNITSYHAKCDIDRYGIIISIYITKYCEDFRLFEMKASFREEDQLSVLENNLSELLKKYKIKNK